MISFQVIPAPKDVYPQVWKLLREFSEQTMGDLCPKSLEEMTAKSEADLKAGGKQYAVMGPDGPLGFIWCENIGDNMAFGHLVFEREGLSTIEKVAATRQAVRKLFEDGFRKIIWMFFADNRAFRIFMKRIGAVEEGLMRQHTRRNGALVDASFMASFPEGI